jgi:hypothetical protein
MFVPYFLAILMLVSKDFVAYMAREIVKKLVAAQMIEAKELQVVTERVHGALLEELSLEDRINDEVRIILETYSDEMRNSGADYQEMFRKVKNELVKKYKAVL